MTFESTELFRSELLDRLQSLTGGATPARWIVAFSGGLDSTVLLHALANCAGDTPVVAVHIDHGLHPDSPAWASHCEVIAKRFGVAYVGLEVAVNEKAAAGLEAAARDARYSAFHELVQANDCLLSAHHADDQAETLLLNLMRGSGVSGIAGIGVSRVYGKGLLLRPLLDVPLQDLVSYAEAEQLEWVEDPSNRDTRFDRNFLRHEILPALASRWPAVAERLRRSAELVGEASELLNDLADVDRLAVGAGNRLGIDQLQALSGLRQRNVLRRAIRCCGFPPPPGTRLQQIVDELIPARPDAQPLVAWRGVEVRRYRNELFILPQATRTSPPAGAELRANGRPVAVGGELGTLQLLGTDNAGISPDIAAAGLAIRFRDGGEDIRVAGHESPQKLKKLLQEAGILPWMRPRLPLLYHGERLVAVANLWIDAQSTAQPGYVVEWHNAPLLK
ncbi:MAG: tRNA lysidine(34) synthetase TilS [Woeseiaceae bacterium]